MLEHFLHWMAHREEDWRIAHRRVIEGVEPLFGEYPEGVHPKLREAAESVGADRLYSHQTKALDYALQGKDVVVATSTASGKSLAFQLPVLDALLKDPKGRALFLYPLKALERDQLDSFLYLAEAYGITAAVYDGDTPEPLRRKIKARPPHVIITNPDMLHLGFLAYHHGWKDFFAGLKYIVLDEVHTYKGIFGSNIAQTLLRTLRVCAHYGSKPQFISCSATIANPSTFVSTLINRPVETVDESGAPSSERSFLFLEPYAGMNIAATKLFIQALRVGLKTIVFTRARKITELITTWALQWAPELTDRISSYRAGFLPEERREIEANLFSGKMDGVISTSALEMGIDVGGLDLCILVGYPGTVINTWQRGGRVGRSGRSSAVVLLAGEDALDRYFLYNPEDFFQRSCEEAILDPYNKEVLKKHIPCAAAEVPISEDEPWFQRPEVAEVITELEEAGALTRSRSGVHSTVSQPQRAVDLRGIGESYGIFLESNRKLIGGSSGGRVFTELHQGAVYLHRAKQYLVTALDLERRNAFVRPTNVSYYTKALVEKTTQILGAPIRSKEVAGFTVREARLKVTEIVTGYEKRRTHGQDLIGVVELNLPPIHFETIGIWIEIPEKTQKIIEGGKLHFMGGIHAMEHAMISMFPLFALCDRNDIGGISTPRHEQVCRAAVFVYDGHAGGVGLSHRAFDIIEELLAKTKSLVEKCECENGCPSCIHSPKCGAGNKPLDKEACLQTLRLLLDPDAAQPVIRKREGELVRITPPVYPAQADTPSEALDIRPVAVVQRPVEAEISRQPRIAASEVGKPVIFTDLVAPATSEVTVVKPRSRFGPPIPKVQLKSPRRDPNDQKNIVYFDLETQRLAQEVGGWGNAHKMRVSLAVTYSERDGFQTFFERDVSRLITVLREADLVVGFNHLRFDYQVLSAYTRENLRHFNNLDILEHVWDCLGFRLKLDHLAQHTLGRNKSGDGLDAVRWFRTGELVPLEEYCREDVAITRDIHKFGISNGFLLYEKDDKTLGKAHVRWAPRGERRRAKKT